MTIRAGINILFLFLASCSRIPKPEAVPSPKLDIEASNPTKKQENADYFKCLPVPDATEVRQLANEGLSGTYKFVLQQRASEEDIKRFAVEANKWHFGVVRLNLGSQQSIFLTSPKKLKSMEDWQAEVATVCALSRPEVEFVDYQFDVGKSGQ